MNKITIKAQRLSHDFEHGHCYEWTVSNPEELYNIKRMQIPSEGYSLVYVVIETSIGMTSFTTNPYNIGNAVFNRIKNMIFRNLVYDFFS